MSHPLTLYDWQSLRDYFGLLATEHVNVRDYGAGDPARLMDRAKSDLSLPVMWLAGPEPPVRVLDNRSDNPIGVMRLTLYVYGQATSEKYSDEDTTYKAMELIVRQVMARMWKEKGEGKVAVDFANWGYGMAEDVIGAVRMVGCRLDLEVMTPLRLTYSADIWVTEEED